jgi:hypothetical protein
MLQVDFYWINREQRSFEWFVSLLSQLEIEQAEQGGAMERQDNHTNGLASIYSHTLHPPTPNLFLPSLY